MRKGLTELVMILDRSGSMGGLEKDTIGGYNSMIEKQKKEEGSAHVTTVLFNHKVEILHDRLPLGCIKPITEEDYSVGGMTALLDAVGTTIERINDIQKAEGPENKAGKVIFVITTDGQENASKKYTYPRLKELIESQQKELGWEFIFLAANIDAVEAAEAYGIDRSRAVNYLADGEGTHEVYASVSCAMRNVRECGSVAADPSWRDRIDADYKRRKKK